jgi:IMP dehydrogenase
MSLLFNWKEITNRSRGLTFDDVLLIPSKSEIRSRKDPVLQTRLTKTKNILIPVISANMDTITESDMAIAMHKQGGLGILHRFMNTAEQVAEVIKVKEAGCQIISASVGVGEDSKDRAKQIVKAGVNLLTIDIAHGHSVQMIEMMKWLKDTFPQVELIAGNLATPEAAFELIQAGADAIKVGIGPGSMCTTRIITGCGVPQLTAIALCVEVARQHNVPVIADGGLKNSGDIMKALAAGADSVMVGSLLSGTLETPGEIIHGRKAYRGMASRKAQDSWRGGIPEGMAPEGESTTVAIKGHAFDVVSELCGGIRSGMSYVNAQSIREIAEKAKFMEMSSNGIRESKAHGLNS